MEFLEFFHWKENKKCKVCIICICLVKPKLLKFKFLINNGPKEVYTEKLNLMILVYISFKLVHS